MNPVHTDNTWMLASVKEPTLWKADDDELWILNPPRRYIFNASLLGSLEGRLEGVSELRGAPKLRPLQIGVNLANRRVLVERHRQRGIGDLLFLTGPLNYLRHVSGHSVHIDLYGLAERAQVLDHHPALGYPSALRGPLHYDDLDYYAAHWFIDSVTECSQEPDQLNVYDALFRQIGVDPSKVEPRFKRPSVAVHATDEKALDALFFSVWGRTQVNLRNGYFVVAPLAHSNLRMANYQQWLGVIAELAKLRPVVVIGQVIEGRMPTTDMTFGAFYQALGQMGLPQVINLIGNTPVRAMMALLSKAAALVCVDSGPLYVAQALRCPAVSLWGTHHPGVRLGYDHAYMENAVWTHRACPHSPCYAYRGFPVDKCPQGALQRACEVLVNADVSEIMARIEEIEKNGHLSYERRT